MLESISDGGVRPGSTGHTSEGVFCTVVSRPYIPFRGHTPVREDDDSVIDIVVGRQIETVRRKDFKLKDAGYRLEVIRKGVLQPTTAKTIWAALTAYEGYPCLTTLTTGDRDSKNPEWLLFNDFRQMVVNEALAIQHHDTVVLVTDSSYECTAAVIACLLCGVTFVPLPQASTEKDVESVINDLKREMRNPTVYVPKNKPTLPTKGFYYSGVDRETGREVILRFSNSSAGTVTTNNGTPAPFTWDAIKSSYSEENDAFSLDGVELLSTTPEPRTGSPAYVAYTSGSTGHRKGVVISEAAVRSSISIMDSDLLVVGFCSPLSIGSTVQNMLRILCNGGRQAILGEVPHFDAVKIIEPTSLSLVPTLWAAFYGRYKERAAVIGSLKAKREARDSLGSRANHLNSGGALPNPAIMDWMKDTFIHCNVTENYGTTEVGSITKSGFLEPGVEVKLVDWEAYKSTDKPFPRGEICVRTTTMCSRYIGGSSSSLVDPDGFYRTGDIGILLDERTVKVIDRKASFFKSSNGLWVAPETPEKILEKIPGVSNALVTGGSAYPSVVAVVVVADASRWCSDGSDLLLEIQEECRRANLTPYETPSKIYVSHQPWSFENGLLTETLKMNRKNLREAFHNEIDAMLQQTLDDSYSCEKTGPVFQILEKYAAPGQQKTTPEHWELDQWRTTHWDSIQCVLLRNFIKRAFGKVVSVGVLLQAAGDLPRLVGLVRGEEGGGKVNWREEVTAVDVQPPFQHTQQTNRVLVTGGAGFLGFSIVQKAVERGLDVVCIVRRSESVSIRSRMESVCVTEAERKNLEKVEIVEGDVTHGFPAVGPADCVIHAACDVNHLKAYEGLKNPNVASTVRALQTGLPVCYLSSSSAQDCSVATADKYPGYIQSKWVSEEICKNTLKEKAVIVRCGMLGPDSRTGRCNPADWLTRYTVEFLKTGKSYSHPSSTLSLCPVDVAAEHILELCLTPGTWSLPSFSFPASSWAVPTLTQQEWSLHLKSLPPTSSVFPLSHYFAEGLGDHSDNEFCEKTLKRLSKRSEEFVNVLPYARAGMQLWQGWLRRRLV